MPYLSQHADGSQLPRHISHKFPLHAERSVDLAWVYIFAVYVNRTALRGECRRLNTDTVTLTDLLRHISSKNTVVCASNKLKAVLHCPQAAALYPQNLKPHECTFVYIQIKAMIDHRLG